MKYFPIILLFFSTLSYSCVSKQENQAENSRPRLIITTDIGGDPDDIQSLIRLLLYSNELNIEGIIASASGTPGELGMDTVQLQAIRDIIHSYSEVWPSLKNHSKDYPSPENLLSVCYEGNPKRGLEQVGENMDTKASDHIISMVDKKDAGKVNIAIWGGQTDVVQALWKVKNERNTEEYLKFIHKIRIYDVNDQDGLYPHIKKEFPELFYILAKAPDGMDKREGVYRGMYLGGDESLTSGEWIESNVLDNHGTLAELYPVKTFTAPNPHGVMKEGDTPSWFYFLDNGLQNADHPEWGGWGGRFLPEEGNFYRDAEDFGLDGIHARATVYRWRPFFQNDFAARLDWCVSEYAEANHPPIALLDGYGAREEIIITSEAGERVVLSAASSFDPDSDELDFFWWTYPEAGTNEVCPELENYLSSEVSFITPFGEEGNNIHLICEVSDRGEPSLTSFRRIIVNME